MNQVDYLLLYWTPPGHFQAVYIYSPNDNILEAPTWSLSISTKNRLNITVEHRKVTSLGEWYAVFYTHSNTSSIMGFPVILSSVITT